MGKEPKHPRAKHWAVFLTGLMLCTYVCAEEEAYRTFTNIEGRTFKGQLTDYDAASETVILKRSDGKTGRMQLATFSDADRLFIADWGASRLFLEYLDIRAGLGSIVLSKQEAGISDVTKRVFDTFYEIRFINRADAPIGKINFEYCIFYNQGERDGYTVQYDEGVCYGTGSVDVLESLSEHVSNTRTVRLYTEGGRVGLFGTDTASIANMRGIWLRLKTKLPSGNELMREYRTSDDAEWKWAPYSFGAGLNEGPKKQTYYYTK